MPFHVSSRLGLKALWPLALKALWPLALNVWSSSALKALSPSALTGGSPWARKVWSHLGLKTCLPLALKTCLPLALKNGWSLGLSVGLPLALMLATAAPLSVCAKPGPRPAPVQVTLLQLNDVYQIGTVDKGARGGLARVATLRQRVLAENPHTFLVLGGDTLSPSLASKLFQGKQMIDLWNQIGLDVATLGNHEFDFGNEVLLQRLHESKFAWVSANVRDKTTGRAFADLPPYVVYTVEGVRIGFFGLLTPDTLNSSHPGANVVFQDPVKTAQKTVAHMKKAGVDVIVAVTHLPMPEDQQVARAAHHSIALIMGGHEHSLLQSVAGATPIFKVGSDARNLGRMDLSIDPQTHQVQSLDWELLPVDANVPEDPTAAALVKTYDTQIDQALGAVIGSTTVALDAQQRPNRSQETNWGDFVADSYREAMHAEVALLNGGSIRSNTTFGPGPLTRKDVLSMLPFGNPVVKVAVSGQTLKEALEHGVSALEQSEAGHFPQVSGVRFVYDGTRPVGSRVIRLSVNGQPIRPDQTYTLALTTYLLEGGDGYAMLKNARLLSDRQEAPPDSEVIMDAISRQKTIAPQTDGRIQRQDSAQKP